MSSNLTPSANLKTCLGHAHQRIILNTVVGNVGAALAGFLLSPIGACWIPLVGALILLAIVSLISRGRAR